MKYGVIILFILVISCMAACKKKNVLTDSTGDVVFYFDGIADTSSILLEAGKHNYFMHTDAYTPADGIPTFMGKVALENAPMDSTWLMLELKNYQLPAITIIDSFKPGLFYSYSVDTILQPAPKATIVQFAFTGITNNLVEVEWYFGDGNTSNLLNPRHLYTISGKVNVSCKVKYNIGGNYVQDFLQNEIDVTPNTNCKAQFSITRNTIADSIFISGINASHYKWILPDNSVNNTGVNNFIYNKPITTRTYVTMIADSNTCNTTYKQIVAPKNVLALCNFNYSSKDTTLTGYYTYSNNYKAAIVTLQKNGKIYKSYIPDKNLIQNNKSILTLTEINKYVNNKNGIPTIKLKANINCTMYNVNNPLDTIVLKSNKMQMALGFY
jgi:hypothetical protein